MFLQTIGVEMNLSLNAKPVVKGMKTIVFNVLTHTLVGIKLSMEA